MLQKTMRKVFPSPDEFVAAIGKCVPDVQALRNVQHVFGDEDQHILQDQVE